MAKKDGSISVLTVEKLAQLVPGKTKIYFRDLRGRDTYVPACEEEIIWQVKGGKVFLHAGEDNGN